MYSPRRAGKPYQSWEGSTTAPSEDGFRCSNKFVTSPNGAELYAFVYRIADEPDKLKEEARERVERSMREADIWRRVGICR